MPLATQVDKFYPQKTPPPLVYRLLSDEERTVPRCKAEERQFFSKGDKVKVVIASVLDLNNFYVTLEDNQDRIEEIENCLSTAATFGLLPYHPMRDQTTIACTKNLDNRWSRIQILKIVHNELEKGKIEITVRFIDSGVEMITTPPQIRAVPDWVLTKPQYAIPCSLAIRPLEYVFQGTNQAGEGCWARAVVEALTLLGKYQTAEELTAFQGLKLRCIKMGDDRSMVDLKLISKESSWSSDLVEGGVAAWMDEIKFDGNDCPIWSD